MTRDQSESATNRSVRTSFDAQPATFPTSTIYDEVASLLRDRGWVKGAPKRGQALCLVAAIDAVVGVGSAVQPGSEGSKLARAGRVGSHLRDLVNVGNLSAWSDDRSRTLDEVLELLTHAALAFPDD
jgi:hypothetical protein